MNVTLQATERCASCWPCPGPTQASSCISKAALLSFYTFLPAAFPQICGAPSAAPRETRSQQSSQPRRQALLGLCAGPILGRGCVPGTRHMCPQGTSTSLSRAVHSIHGAQNSLSRMFFLTCPTGLPPCFCFSAPPPKVLSLAMLSRKLTLSGGHIQRKEDPLDLSQ